MFVNSWDVKEVDGKFFYGTSPVVKCSLCGERWTYMVHTKLCDSCWELKRRVEADPQLARRVLAEMDCQE